MVMAIIAVLASIAMPTIFSKLRDADRTKAVAHASEIKNALVSFETEYGIRPGQKIVDEGDLDGAAAGTSNDIFRQLFIGGLLKSEAIFFAPSKVCKKPDNDIGNRANKYAQALEKGENGFMYVDNPYSKQGAPVCAAPLDRQNEFDAEAYNGLAVVLKSDGSVDTLRINEDSHKVEIKVGGSKADMFSSSNKTFVDPPKLVYPNPR